MTNEITDQRISLETAKLLKAKKFDVIVKGSIVEYITTQIEPENPEEEGPFGWKKGELEFDEGYFRNFDSGADFSNKNYTMYAMPTQSVVQRWLREKHKIYVEVYVRNPSNPKFGYDYHYVNEAHSDWASKLFNTYEEALE
jgi:hypothetical protein